MKAIFTVQNLKCNGCASTITNKLSSITEIANIKVTVETSEVSFDYEHDDSLLKAKDVLKQNGYPEIGDSNSIGTKAKSYVSCAIGKMS